MELSVTHEKRFPIRINAVDYMKNGAGRYASVADFKMFENFFKAGNLPAREKPYSFDEIGNKLYIDFTERQRVMFGPKGNGFTVSVSQYGIDTSSSDYIERAFIFGSTQVTVTQTDIAKLQFFVRPDGSREIRNLRITPKDDNFDFIGGSSSQDASGKLQKWAVGKANAVFNSVLDPKGIGRSVPLVYTDTDKLPFVNITDKDFKRLQSEKSNQEKPDILMEETGILLFRQGGGLFHKLKKSPALYDKSLLGRWRDIEQNANEMYQKTRDRIKEDLNKMSLDDRNERDQYAADIDKPTALTIEDMPQNAQKIYHQGKQIFADFCAQKNIVYDANSLDNIAMSLVSVAYTNKMSGVSLININDNGKVLIGHKAPGLIMASVDMWEAAKTPVEESLSQIQQTAQQIEYEEQQKQIVQSQSHGARLS
ncbi:calcium-binding protein [Neisseria flavescens]|uniref:calcium-binding protein n=1 Tax=Neisseria flavescens TaxID=484 RepID=UPI001E284F72|nr:calcium-binding protein [Neisseria flavescens]